MRTEVILHRDCEPSYEAWYDAMATRCKGQAISVKILARELHEQLRVHAGKPAGAELRAKRRGGDELWAWEFTPETTIHYVIRDRKNLMRFTWRRVIIVRVELRPAGGSPQLPPH